MNILHIKLKSRVLFLTTDLVALMPETAESGAAEAASTKTIELKAAESEAAERKPAEPKAAGLKVLWLLHGASGDCSEWLTNTHLLKLLEGRTDLMVVMPSALNSDYGSYPDFGTGYDFPGFFFEELMPFVRGQLGGSDRPEDNFIAGASMGGYGALMLGLLRPELFGGIGALGASMRESSFLEPYRRMSGSEFREYALAHRREFPTEYGSAEYGIKPKEINVIAKYPTVQDFLDSPECMYNRFPKLVERGILPPIYMMVGTEDLFYEPVRRFEALTQKLGTDKVTFDFAAGYGHEIRLWDEKLKDLLAFFGI